MISQKIHLSDSLIFLSKTVRFVSRSRSWMGNGSIHEYDILTLRLNSTGCIDTYPDEHWTAGSLDEMLWIRIFMGGKTVLGPTARAYCEVIAKGGSWSM